MATDLIPMLKKVGALMTDDHFIYTSGKHGSVYINKDALYPHTDYASEVGKMMARRFSDVEVDVVVGPALGGIILSQWTAYHLSELKNTDVLGVYTEKDSTGNQIFTRGYDQIVTGKKVLVVEDLTTTGGSVQNVIRSVLGSGGEVVGVCVMVNRNPEEVSAEGLDVPKFVALAEYPAEAWDPEDCELCKKGMPVNTKVGHGRKK